VTEHCLLVLLRGVSTGVQILGLGLLGVMAWQSKSTRDSAVDGAAEARER
jgi:hypothetical protein